MLVPGSCFWLRSREEASNDALGISGGRSGGGAPRRGEDPARNAEGDRDVILETQIYPVSHLALN